MRGRSLPVAPNRISASRSTSRPPCCGADSCSHASHTAVSQTNENAIRTSCLRQPEVTAVALERARANLEVRSQARGRQCALRHSRAWKLRCSKHGHGFFGRSLRPGARAMQAIRRAADSVFLREQDCHRGAVWERCRHPRLAKPIPEAASLIHLAKDLGVERVTSHAPPFCKRSRAAQEPRTIRAGVRRVAIDFDRRRGESWKLGTVRRVEHARLIWWPIPL